MLTTVVRRRRNGAEIHCAVAARSAAPHRSHRAEMLRIADEMPTASLLRWSEDPGATTADLVFAGRVDLEQLALENNAEVYLCGPLAFMAALRAGLIRKGVDADSIHYEVFGPGPELQMLQAA